MHLLRDFVRSISPIPEQDFALLVPHVAVQAVAKGAHLLAAGQVCKSIFFANTGFLRMYYVGAGSWFSVMSGLM